MLKVLYQSVLFFFYRVKNTTLRSKKQIDSGRYNVNCVEKDAAVLNEERGKGSIS